MHGFKEEKWFRYDDAYIIARRDDGMPVGDGDDELTRASCLVHRVERELPLAFACSKIRLLPP